MYKQIGTILGNSFVIDDNVELFWVTFDQSVATLSINTLCGERAKGSPDSMGVGGWAITLINYW